MPNDIVLLHAFGYASTFSEEYIKERIPDFDECALAAKGAAAKFKCNRLVFVECALQGSRSVAIYYSTLGNGGGFGKTPLVLLGDSPDPRTEPTRPMAVLWDFAQFTRNLPPAVYRVLPAIEYGPPQWFLLTGMRKGE